MMLVAYQFKTEMAERSGDHVKKRTHTDVASKLVEHAKVDAAWIINSEERLAEEIKNTASMVPMHKITNVKVSILAVTLVKM